MTSEEIKKELLFQCQRWLNARRKVITNTLDDIKKSLLEETKSSAGDKHETGRAMLQIERENAGRQLAEIEKVERSLAQVTVTSSNGTVRLGSLVLTSQANYFIAISVGVLKVNESLYYVVSPASPIGSLLMSKCKDDTVIFNKQTIQIVEIL